MNILTWNLACNSMSNTESRARGVCQTIFDVKFEKENEEFDIIIFTEMKPVSDFGKIIKDKLKENNYHIILPYNVRSGMTSAVLIAIKREKYNKPIKEMYEFNLAQRYSAVSFSDPNNKRNMKVLGVHVPPAGYDKKAQIHNIKNRKEPYLKSIIKYANSIKENEFAIIGGDFNPYSSSAEANWKSEYPKVPLTNVIDFLVQKKEWENCTPNNGWKGNSSSYNRLDYIFLSSAFNNTSYTANFLSRGNSYSDHDPLIVKLTF